MDDAAYPLIADSAEQLRLDLKLAAELLVDTAFGHGLTINFKPAKTEAMAYFIGTGSEEVKASGHEGTVGVIELADGQLLRLVPKYCHLGTMVAASRSALHEVNFRAASGTKAAGALMRRVFGSPSIPRASRVMVAQACVVSRCLHHAGAWTDLPRKQLAAINAVVMRPLRAVAGCLKPPSNGELHITNPEVISMLRTVPLEMHIAFPGYMA